MLSPSLHLDCKTVTFYYGLIIRTQQPGVETLQFEKPEWTVTDGIRKEEEYLDTNITTLLLLTRHRPHFNF